MKTYKVNLLTSQLEMVTHEVEADNSRQAHKEAEKRYPNCVINYAYEVL